MGFLLWDTVSRGWGALLMADGRGRWVPGGCADALDLFRDRAEISLH